MGPGISSAGARPTVPPRPIGTPSHQSWCEASSVSEIASGPLPATKWRSESGDAAAGGAFAPIGAVAGLGAVAAAGAFALIEAAARTGAGAPIVTLVRIHSTV